MWLKDNLAGEVSVCGYKVVACSMVVGHAKISGTTGPMFMIEVPYL